MERKIARLSYKQLLLLSILLSRQGKIWEVKEIEKKTGLKHKVLGGVLSSLSRTKLKQKPLIEPMGKSRLGPGLRWRLNLEGGEIKKISRYVGQLLETY